MAAQPESTFAGVETGSLSARAKFFMDVASVFEIKFLMFMRGWAWYLMGTLVFPVGMFYFARALAPDSPEAV